MPLNLMADLEDALDLLCERRAVVRFGSRPLANGSGRPEPYIVVNHGDDVIEPTPAEALVEWWRRNRGW